MHRIILPSVTCPALPYFPTLSHKRHDFRGEKIEQKTRVLILHTTFAWNISHSTTNSARYYYKCIYGFMHNTRYSCHILMQLQFSQQIFEKYSNIKFHKNPSSGSQVVPCGWTDGRADMTKLVVAFCNFANAPKTIRETQENCPENICGMWLKVLSNHYVLQLQQ
jgi:hypothetical protein